MSYSIYYKHLFLRLSDNSLIPMVEAGDNNVWDGRKRSREWQSCHFGKTIKLSYTEDEILRDLDRIFLDVTENARRHFDDFPQYVPANMTPGKDAKERFGYYYGASIYGKTSHTTTWGAFRNFFLSAIRNAVPFETYTSHFGGLRFEWYEKDPCGGPSRFKQTQSYLNESELCCAWDECFLKADGQLWTAPSSQFDAGLAEEAANAVSARGGRIIAVSDNVEQYIKSFLPFETTESEADAGLFRKDFYWKNNLFYVASRLTYKKIDSFKFCKASTL